MFVYTTEFKLDKNSNHYVWCEEFVLTSGAPCFSFIRPEVALALDIKTITNGGTVKPVYKGYSRGPENVTFMNRCPLYTGYNYMLCLIFFIICFAVGDPVSGGEGWDPPVYWFNPATFSSSKSGLGFPMSYVVVLWVQLQWNVVVRFV